MKKHGEVRDPRFDERAGSFNESLFKKSYAFLDNVKKSEKRVVQKEARRARNPEKRAQLQTLVQQMVSGSLLCFLCCCEEEETVCSALVLFPGLLNLQFLIVISTVAGMFDPSSVGVS